MALLDLSLVTKALAKLIEERVEALLDTYITSSVWPANRKLTVSPMPPDELQEPEGDVLGLYLYHVIEDAHFKNTPPPSSDQPPVQYTPMALNLYYQLNAHSDQKDATGTYREQLLLGLATKSLHECPVISDSTEIVGKNDKTVKILEEVGLSGDGNRLRIALQPVPYNEAVSYWTAGSSPLRLATYYQVSVILLEPEKPKSRVGRVLTYGAYPFVSGAPRLDSSQNTVSFSLPDGSASQEVELQPAQAPPAPPPPGAVPTASQVAFTGSDLTGDSSSLWLKNARWEDELVEADSTWDVAVQKARVTATIQQTASGKAVLPGIYGALVKVVRKRTTSDGKTRTFEHLSNELPFVITPHIDKTATAASGRVTVTGYAFQHGTPAKDLKVQVYVGDRRLEAKSSGNPGPGEFVVTSETVLKLQPPAELASSGWVPLRILVEGAESLPEWIEV